MLETLTSEGKALIEVVMARKRAKEEARRAWLDEYNKQLAAGNSNMNKGATHKSHRRIFARKVM